MGGAASLQISSASGCGAERAMVAGRQAELNNKRGTCSGRAAASGGGGGLALLGSHACSEAALSSPAPAWRQSLPALPCPRGCLPAGSSQARRWRGEAREHREVEERPLAASQALQVELGHTVHERECVERSALMSPTPPPFRGGSARAAAHALQGGAPATAIRSCS